MEPCRRRQAGCRCSGRRQRCAQRVCVAGKAPPQQRADAEAAAAPAQPVSPAPISAADAPAALEHDVGDTVADLEETSAQDPAADASAASEHVVGDTVADFKEIRGGEAVITQVWGTALRDGKLHWVRHIKKRIINKRYGWPENMTGAAGARYKLQLEVAWLRKLHHTGLTPRVLEVHDDGGPSHVIMEHIHGCRLGRFLAYSEFFLEWGTRPQLVAVLLALIGALRTLARLDMQHNDLHPSNVLVRDETWAVVLLDPACQDMKVLTGQRSDCEHLRRHCSFLPALREQLTEGMGIDDIERLVRGHQHPRDAARLERVRPAEYMRLWGEVHEHIDNNITPSDDGRSANDARRRARQTSRGASRAASEPPSGTGDASERRAFSDNADGDGNFALPTHAVESAAVSNGSRGSVST